MTQLGYSAPLKQPTSIDYEAVKRNGYHDQGVLVVDVNDPRLTWPERELVRQLGEKLYGKAANRRS